MTIRVVLFGAGDVGSKHACRSEAYAGIGTAGIGTARTESRGHLQACMQACGER